MRKACDPDNKLTTFEVSENSLPQLRKLYLESALSRCSLVLWIDNLLDADVAKHIIEAPFAKSLTFLSLFSRPRCPAWF